MSQLRNVNALEHLTEAQKCALQQMRQKMSDVLCDDHDDHFLLRWLRARKWKPDDAEKMLRANLRARAMWNVGNLEKWEVPRVLKEYVPFGMIGFDNEGSPVIVCPFAKLDIWGVLHSATRFDFQRYLVLLLERFMRAGNERSRTHGPSARQVVVFFDMADFNLRPFLWRPAAEFVTASLRQYEANYPELLKMCYIINAPRIFSMVLSVIRRFLDDYTMSKLKIYKAGSDKWKQPLFAHVDADIFPKCFGGNCVDDDGDTQCKSKIVWGGVVPTDLYLASKDGDDDNDNDGESKPFVEATLQKGHKLKLRFEVEAHDSNHILAWEFRVLSHDIKFGIYSVDKRNAERMNEIDLSTVYADEIMEYGFIVTRPYTTYVVVFDNSYSYFRSKQLRYCIQLLHDADIAASSGSK